jgi:CDP-diacylglycerol--glycerol-3-phosphate 3-phosphatidyltransferase
MIKNAKNRVRIASLYVGPATSNRDDCEEAVFLEALSELVDRNHTNQGNHKVSVKIILDEKRALRPVPIVAASSAEKQSNSSQEKSTPTTSSAEAVARAIQGGPYNDAGSSTSLHLFPVLPPTTIAGINWLPNPLDEVAGVFHIKIYIVDDQLLLSGANLSREYFRDRMDRYLHLVDGANGLVDFYAELVEILCRHSTEYKLSTNDSGMRKQHLETQRAAFLREITEHFHDPNQKTSSMQSAQDLFAMGENTDNTSNSDNKIVAVGVPTFQAPVGYFRQKDVGNAILTPVSVVSDIAAALSMVWFHFRIDRQAADQVDFVTDVDATLNLLREAGNWNIGSNPNTYSAQLSSAYLNLTPSLLSVLRGGYQKVELLTAGQISHGFKPKKKGSKDGSQGKDWTIPSIFSQMLDDCMSSLRSKPTAASNNNHKNNMDVLLYFWERPDWTFHAKGIWLKQEDEEMNAPNGPHKDGNGDNSKGEVAAVVVGSSNFGYRSFYRDMESNLLLVFPPGSSSSQPNDIGNGDIALSFREEWKNLLTSTKREVLNEDHSDVQEEKGGTKEMDAAEKVPPLPWPILKSIPYIKTYF